MKLKNISLWALMFVAAIATLASCSDKNDPTYLSEVKVSSSYVSIPATGGSTTITVTATDAWQIDTAKLADNDKWFKIDHYNGTAGTTKVTFTADSTKGGRTVELLLNCGAKTQHINVIQGSVMAEAATCYDVIKGPESKTFKVTGTCTKITNDIYGNWYLNDGTGEIYIYGTLDDKGAEKNFKSLGIEVGDIVTVQGPKKVFGSTIELVNVTVLNIKKSLIKVDSISAKEIPAAGGTIIAYLTCKGNGFGVEIPDSLSDWISVVSTTGGTYPVVTFRVAPNDGRSRKANITFRSYDNKGNESIIVTEINQAAYILPHGENPDDPYTVAEAVMRCEQIGSTTDSVTYYAKGIISEISEISTKYGNATFTISDDGTNPPFLTCFRSRYLDNEKFTAEDQIQVGDEVVISGKLVFYKGEKAEFSGDVYIHKLSRKGAAEAGTPENPFTPEQAAAYIDKGGTEPVCVAGIISKIANNGEFGAKYGNATFFISEDGTYHEDPLLDFEAYRVLYLGNRKWQEGDKQIAVGDKVILYGPLTKYNTTYETKQNEAYIYSLNGKTE